MSLASSSTRRPPMPPAAPRPDPPPPVDTPRHRIFQRARERADLSVEQLWLRYLELGGLADLIELDGFLHALVPLDDLQQDMLAHALNEGLEDAYRAARVPYLRPTPDLSPAS